jgi:SagB-type dehydrogenase family enzyme
MNQGSIARRSSTTITGLLARQEFKEKRYGSRHDLDDLPGVALTVPADERIAMRRTSRSFDPTPVGFAEFSTLLASMRMISLAGEPKCWYPSAGSAYPVQVYVVIAPERVRGVRGGSYYYHPERSCLVPLAPAAAVSVSAHADLNKRAFRQSAFTLYLIGRMDAITPLYGDLAWDFAVFEAGAIAQLLGQVASECGLGLCPVGEMNTTALPELFGLTRSDRFLHAMLGGIPAAVSSVNAQHVALRSATQARAEVTPTVSRRRDTAEVRCFPEPIGPRNMDNGIGRP